VTTEIRVEVNGGDVCDRTLSLVTDSERCELNVAIVAIVALPILQ